MHPLFVIKKTEDQYCFELVDAGGEVLLSANNLRSRADCHQGIAQVRSSVLFAVHFEKRKELSGQYSFVLRNKAGDILAQSRSFWSPSSRDFAMVTVRREAADASIEEQFQLIEDIKE